MKYRLELRDKDGKFYTDSQGYYITPSDLLFTDESSRDAEKIERQFKRLADIYKSICKEGTQITIYCEVLNTISNRLMIIYSYYFEGDRFVTH